MKFDKSGYAALGWSIVSFALQVAANTTEARDFVLTSSAVITRIMTRYAQYEILYRGSQADKDFDGLMTGVYKAILLHIIAMNDYLQQCRTGSSSEL